ncbi:dephospho-CoA kinase [Desulfuromonas carbonis]|uniref:dephospho-CoA kinase n=1 Tax=Desulfuromonas sp. DDH964 TaxID=1823759 RepID=UPI00078B27E9|nr:dephospho-CoA kinase [Desulfuromonas sp. DDH964]AMV71319.1 dephospho-coenzyme A kinase [Desulfuromonas sp. DDH964]
MILGITGSIASGKSTVSAMFEARGAVLVSADQLAREAVRPGSATLARLVERFGAEILASSGKLDRARLGTMIFADPAARQDLNRIIHPAIAALAEEELAILRRSGAPLVVYEAPLLFEAGASDRVDRVLVVTVDPEVQLQRLMRRDGLDAEAARQRVAAQMPQAEKLARADFVIDNSGSRKLTEDQVAALWTRLTATPAPRQKS